MKARSWTRKLKEYIELMNPTNKFPFYFMHRDNRGDVSIGRSRLLIEVIYHIIYRSLAWT